MVAIVTTARPKKESSNKDYAVKKEGKLEQRMGVLKERATKLKEFYQSMGIDAPVHTNLATQQAYGLFNSCILEEAQLEYGLTGNLWISYNQARELGIELTGAIGVPIMIAKQYINKDEQAKIDAGEIQSHEASYKKMFRLFPVFSISQAVLPLQQESA